MGFALTGVSYDYGTKKVLHDFSATLAPGKFYGIVGPNGCGKSTLLDILAGHRRPAGGSVTYGGKALSTYSKKELAAEFALVPQNFYINFPFTAKEIIMMGRYPHIARFSAPSEHDMAVVASVMAQTDTETFGERLVTELSGGERQRIVFARALAQDTPVLILDEATSNLDIKHSLKLLQLAAGRVRQEGRTVVAVFQDLNLAAAFCDELVFIRQGEVAAAGAVDQVLNPQTIRSVFDVEAKVDFEPYANCRQVVFKQ